MNKMIALILAAAAITGWADNSAPVSTGPDCDRSACEDFSPGDCDHHDCEARTDKPHNA